MPAGAPGLEGSSSAPARYLCASRSRISFSTTTSGGTAGGAGGASFFFVSWLMGSTMTN